MDSNKYIALNVWTDLRRKKKSVRFVMKTAQIIKKKSSVKIRSQKNWVRTNINKKTFQDNNKTKLLQTFFIKFN